MEERLRLCSCACRTWAGPTYCGAVWACILLGTSTLPLCMHICQLWGFGDKVTRDCCCNLVCGSTSRPTGSNSSSNPSFFWQQPFSAGCCCQQCATSFLGPARVTSTGWAWATAQVAVLCRLSSTLNNTPVHHRWQQVEESHKVASFMAAGGGV